jgi:hypothetical protein
LSKELLTGAVGGIIGVVTAVIGVMWIFIANTFLLQIFNYSISVSDYLTYLAEPSVYPYPPPNPIPFFPSWSSFSVFTLVLTIPIIVTGILLGVGFYGTYKIGGSAMGAVGFTSSVVGTTLGALLINMGNLTTGYTYAGIIAGGTVNPLIPLPAPNFSLIGLGFAVISFATLLLGAASISVREMTEKPSAFMVAGILSIVGSLVNMIGSWALSRYGIFIIGFGLIFVALILWTWVFFSSRNL